MMDIAFSTTIQGVCFCHETAMDYLEAYKHTHTHKYLYDTKFATRANNIYKDYWWKYSYSTIHPIFVLFAQQS